MFKSHSSKVLRPNSALLNRQEWENLILRCGYEDVVSFVNTPDPDESGQTAFMARRGPPTITGEINSNKEERDLDGSDDTNKKGVLIIFAEDGAFFDELSECFSDEFDQAIRISSDQDISEAFKGVSGVRAIIHAFGAESLPSDESLSEDDLVNAQRSGSEHLLKLVKTLSSIDFEVIPNVLIIFSLKIQ